MSFGLAGGLAPTADSGDLILADAVVLPGGGRVATDVAWRRRLMAAMARAGTRPHETAVAGSDRVLATAAAKRALFETAGAWAVDMESHAVAAAAQAAGRRFVVVSAIADPHDQALPRAARSRSDRAARSGC